MSLDGPRKPLKRNTPLKQGAWLRKNSPTPKRPRPRATGSKPAGSRGFPAAVRAAAIARDGGCMARHVWPEVRCGGGVHVHHVRVKGYRGAPDNTLANALTLCGNHHHHAHDVDRAGAEAAGIIVRSLGNVLDEPTRPD